jgi:hypothetical protein
MPAFSRSRPVEVTSAADGVTATFLVRSFSSGAGGGSGAAGASGSSSGAGAGGAAGTVPGGSVKAPRAGFSMSMAPPHLAHLVRALGRVPSFVSSNLYRAEQDGQTMIMLSPRLACPEA